MHANTALYDQDLARWGHETAALLRAGRWRAIDLKALAEELDSLGTADAHRLWEQLRELLGWFLAWNYAPAQRMQHPHWYVRVVHARTAILAILTTSPSLRPVLTADLASCYTYARTVASEETGLALETFPATCPWTVTQVVHTCFWPMGDHELSTRPLWVEPDEIEAPLEADTSTDLHAASYARARQDAARQMALPLETLPATCPWTAEQVLDPDFWPDAPQESHPTDTR
jgi:Domain of unknown function DUF29